MNKTEQLQYDLEVVRDYFEGKTYWKHYKGGVYEVLDFVYDTEEDGVSVIYARVDGPDFDPAAEDDIRFSRPFRVQKQFVRLEGQERISRFSPVVQTEVWTDAD